MKTRLDVVGGSYAEVCAFPRRDVFRGSGGRAAVVLARLGAKVRLTTVTGPALGKRFADLATRQGYELAAHQGTEDIWFRYRHPLSRPDIYPPRPRPVTVAAPIVSEQALVFGMLETRPVVHAQRAVYDPQDGRRAQPFEQNGSHARELALVLSYSEGKALTSQDAPATIVAALLSAPSTKVVILKCGPLGALVQTRAGGGWVRPFLSRRVYKIGSGDVFSASFAFAWLVERLSPMDAAWFASRVTSEYVASGFDCFPPALVAKFHGEARKGRRRYKADAARAIPEAYIYIAGPFFTTSQQWLIDEVRNAFQELGFNVFSPIHDVGVGPPDQVVPADLHALEGAGLVFAILDGTDAGTLFEVGYAQARCIPIVALAEHVDSASLTMVLGAGCEVTDDLSTAVHVACWHLMGDV